MTSVYIQHVQNLLSDIHAQGLEKRERIIISPQSAKITLENGKTVLNFCANNYLDLANDPRLIQAAHDSLKNQGLGMASVRFICGTQSLHKELESALAQFLKKEDAILYSSCFDANGGLFETLLTEKDAIISDSLNHASIIDGVRLCKAQRFRYENRNMDDLEQQLKSAKAAGARFILVATDGVFSMDGTIAPLPEICTLAEQHGALVMVDDSHATGVIGPRGEGTPAHFGVTNRVTLLTGTFGKALGGASGGYIAGPKDLIALLRQRSRPYLFSNTLAPCLAAATLTALAIIASPEGEERRQRLHSNATLFRKAMTQAGFSLIPGEYPIVPVMLGNAEKAAQMADALLEKGIYVIAFSYPVVPQNQARIRVQLNAGHTPTHVQDTAEAFASIAHSFPHSVL
jgi:glycine C-acetyltransferase